MEIYFSQGEFHSLWLFQTRR